MRIFALAARGAAMGLFIVSCSSDHSSGSTSSGTSGTAATSSGTGGGSATDALIQMVCDKVSMAYCDAARACTPQATTCQCWPELISTREFFFCYEPLFRSLLKTSLEAGTTIFDQTEFDKCLAVLGSLTASGPACAEPPQAVFESTCYRSFQGQIAPGGACGDWGGWHDGVLPCKDGTCDNGVCVPFLKPGVACIAGGPLTSAQMCNWVKEEWCHQTLDAGGGGGGDAGAEAMGICAPAREIGDSCNYYLDCKSLHCDTAMSKCVLPNGCGSFP